MDPSDRERYSRQILFPGIGEAGQEALLRGHAVIAGCGALGSFHAAAIFRHSWNGPAFDAPSPKNDTATPPLPSICAARPDGNSGESAL